jgi:hypothetical protein
MTKLEIDKIMDAIELELDIFQWCYGIDRGNNRGEISLDRNEVKLILEVWVADNDSEDDNIKPLLVSVDVTYEEPREQIRNLIHRYLCHEADEQMWFRDERPFYPHQREIE